MALIGQWVFVPLAVLLLILAFWELARRRVLGCKGIQRLEKRLTLSERGYWAAFALILAAGVWVRCLPAQRRYGSIWYKLADVF